MSTALWQFVKPEATINLITNPSFETNTTGWTAGSGTLARSTEQQAVGVYSGKYTPASGTSDGAYYSATLTVSTAYTLSLSVYGANGVPYQVRIRNQSAGSNVSTVTFTGSAAWVRIVVSFTSSSSGTSYRFYVEKNNSSSTAAYYMDAAQLEQADHATTYCDGDQEDCTWTGTAHGSTAQRAATTAGGGRVTDLTEGNYLRVRDHTGVGTPPIEIIDSLPAQGDGADYQTSIHRPRNFSLIGTIQGTGSSNDSARTSYHTKRSNLITAFLPHRLPTDQPVKMRYKWLTKSVELKAFYQNGLEKGGLISAVIEEVSLGFRAENPFYRRVMGTANGDYGADQGGAALTVRQTVSSMNYIIQCSPAGVWSALGTGLNAGARCLTIGPDGLTYIGGDFTTANGSTANHVVAWNPFTSTYSTLSTGTNSLVFCSAAGPDSVYFGGSFTSPGASLTKWTISSGAFSTLGAGTNGEVYGMAVGHNGNVCFGGNFTSPGTNIGMWNGTTLSAMSTGIAEFVMAVAVGPDGTFYAGDGAGEVWRWSGSAWVSIGTVGNSIAALAFGPDGKLYAAGGVALDGAISRYNGSTWEALASSINNPVSCIVVTPDNVPIIGGEFTQIDGLTLSDSLAQCVGGNWIHQSEIDFPGSPAIYAIARNKAGYLFISTNGSGGSPITGAVSAVTYGGNTYTYPKLTMTGPGAVYSLTNYTTDKAIYFNLTLLSGETAVLNLNPEVLSFVSDFRGNLLTQGAILGGSDHDNFYLSPGSNSLSIFINDASATAVLTWEELYSSFDGVI